MRSKYNSGKKHQEGSNSDFKHGTRQRKKNRDKSYKEQDKPENALDGKKMIRFERRLVEGHSLVQSW